MAVQYRRYVARKPADTSIPPPLRALGGWEEAEWFDPSVLTEGEVVGITLPAVAGSRKQNFELDERTAAAADPKTRGAKKAVPARVPAGIGQILDAAGSIQAASFRRPRFFFGAPPTLFFAAVPTAKLKTRAADALRRNLIASAYRGCVLSHRADLVTAMFWPGTEAEVTAFIRAAGPPYALHTQFDRAEEERRSAEPARRGSLGRASAAAPPSQRQQDTAERERLLTELDGLRAKICELERLHSVEGAMETLGLTDARLRAMLLLLHPDKHGNSEAANEAAKWINGLRDVLRRTAKG